MNIQKKIWTFFILLTAMFMISVYSYASYDIDLRGNVTGLESNVSYTAAKYDFSSNSYGEFTVLNDSTRLTPGVWGIKADDAEPVVLFSVGNSSGYINFWNRETNQQMTGIYEKNDNYIPGKWTYSTNGIFNSIGYHSTTSDLIMRVNKAKFLIQAEETVENEDGTTSTTATWKGASPIIGEANKLQESWVRYGFTNEQVIPANSITEYKPEYMKWIKAGGMYFNKNSEGKTYTYDDMKGIFTFVVKVPGDPQEIRYSIETVGMPESFVAPEEMANSNGYLVAIEYAPYGACPDDIFYGNTSDASGTCYSYIGMYAGDNTISFTTSLPAAPVVFDGFGIIGADPGRSYEIAPAVLGSDGTEISLGSWQEYKYSSLTERNLSGLYAVREVYDGKMSEYTLAYAYGSLDNRKSLGHLEASSEDGLNYVAVKATDDFVAGYWTGKWNGHSIGTHSTFGTWGVATLGAQVTKALTTNLATAIKGSDTSAIYNAKKAISNAWSEVSYKYAFDSDEIIKVDEADTFYITYIQNNGAILFDYVRTKVIAYVADKTGKITSYTYKFADEAYTLQTVKRTIDFSQFLPKEGYLVGVEIYPASDMLPEEVTGIQQEGNTRFIMKVDPANYIVNEPQNLPESSESPQGLFADGNIIKGLLSTKRYEYAVFDINGIETNEWQAVPLGVTEFDAESVGLIAVKYGSDGYSHGGSVPSYVYVAGKSTNILHLVTKETNKQKTTSDGYGIYRINGSEYYLNSERYYSVTDGTEFTGDTSDAEPIYKTVDVPDTVYLSNTEENRNNVKFTEGKWSGILLSTELAQFHNYNALVLGTTYTPILKSLATDIRDAADESALAAARAKAAEFSASIYYSYAFTPDEILPMSDFKSFSFSYNVRQTGFNLIGNARTKFVLKVIDSSGKAVDRIAYKNAAYTLAGGTHTFTLNDFDDTDGYIVGIVIYPYGEITEGSYFDFSSETNGDYNICLKADGYKVTRPITEADIPSYLIFEDNTISGFIDGYTYEYGLYSIAGDMGEWTEVSGNTAEIMHTLNGLIGVRIKGDGINYKDSLPALHYVPIQSSSRTELGNVTDSIPAFKTSQDWLPGIWTGDHLSWHDQTANAYAFLDESAGVTCAMLQELWLYQVTKEEAEARLAEDCAKSIPSSWVNNNVTSNPARFQAVIDAHYGVENYADNLEENKLALQNKIAKGFSERNIAYAFDDTEIIPVNEFLSIAFTSKARQGGLFFDGVKSKVVIHVINENARVTQHEWYSDEWSVSSNGTWKKLTVDVQAIEGLPSSGWVVGIEFYPWSSVDVASISAESAGIHRVDASNIAYAFTQQHLCMGYYPAEYTLVTIPHETPVVEMDMSTATLTVTNYDPNVIYAYSADGGKRWTQFDGQSVTMTKAGKTYIVKSLANAMYKESAVSNAVVSPSVTLVGSSIVLDGQIGIKIYIDIDTTVLSDIVFKMTKVNNDYQCQEGDKNYSSLYRVSGTSSFSIGTEWATKITLDKKSGLYYTVLHIPAKELDNTVIECDIGGYRSVYISFGDYITSAKALAQEGKTEFVLSEALINKLENYTAYAENYFNKGTLEFYNSEASLDKIEAATKTNTELEGVQFYGTSLILEETVTIRHYFEITDLDAFNKAYTSDIPYGIKGNFIYYDITDISAQNIGKQHTLTINGEDSVFEIAYSVANYIKSAISYDDKNLVSLANAIYDYGLEASKYEEMRTRNTNIAVNIAADGLENAILTNTVSDEAFYEEKIKSYISGYLLGTEVGRMMFNVTYRRSVVDSDTIDSMLYNVARDENGFLLKDENGNVTKTIAPETTYTMLKKYRTMIERGIDIIGMAVEETQKYGAEAWFSIRMNDHHNLEDPGFNSSFSYDAPTLSGINNKRTYMDFTKPAVQAYYKEYIREMCEKYDIDGIELDFLRSCPVMGSVTDKQMESLNAFISDIRKITNEVGEAKGKKIGLAVRIYSEEQQNLNYGIDAAQWVAEGSVDQITVEGWYIPTYYNIPVEEWRQSIDERNVNGNNYTLLCGTDWAVRCDSTAYSGYIMWITLEQFKGFVSSAYDKGADGIYIFNHFNLTNDAGATTYYIDDNGVKTKVNVIKDKLIAANSQQEAEENTRVYVNTCHDYSNSLYPISIGEYTFELNTGTKAEEEYLVVVGIDSNDGYTDNLLKVTVNGIEAEQITDVPCETGFEWKVSTSNEPAAQHVSETAPRVMQFRINDLSAINDGVNTVTVTVTDEARPQSIKWLEIRAK